MGSTALAGGPTATPTATAGAAGAPVQSTLAGGPAGATLGADALGQISTALNAVVQALQGLVQAITSMIGGAAGGGGVIASKVPTQSVAQLTSLPAKVSTPTITPTPQTAAPQLKAVSTPPATKTAAS